MICNTLYSNLKKISVCKKNGSNIFISFFLLALIALLSSCSEEIEWEEYPMEDLLVIEGGFSNEYTKHRLYLSKTAPYFSNTLTPKVSNAKITLTGAGQTIEYEEKPIGSGTYFTRDSVAGLPKNEYFLDIELEEAINGSRFYTASTYLNKGIDIDSLDAVMVENPFYFPQSGQDSLLTIITVFGQEPAEIENYYQITVYNNFVPLNDTIDEVSIASDKEGLNGSQQIPFFYLTQFNENDTLRLQMASVEALYRNFIIGIQNVANQSFDPFDMSGPPANPKGNVFGENGALAYGFFNVEYVSIGLTTVRYEQFDLP